MEKQQAKIILTEEKQRLIESGILEEDGETIIDTCEIEIVE